MSDPDEKEDPCTIECTFDGNPTALKFRSVSEARLAALYLEDKFPYDIFSKVCNLILDESFKPEEISFNYCDDLFKLISGQRQQRSDQILTTTEETAKKLSGPPLAAVDLVAEYIMDSSPPLDLLADEQEPLLATRSNSSDLQAMSLVSKGWRGIARSFFRRRAVIPYHRIKEFLCSPLCGDWVTEIIIYWTIENEATGATQPDIWLLETLFDITPAVKSLVFCSSMTWHENYLMPPFYVRVCLEIIADKVKRLQNLWLKHYMVDSTQIDPEFGRSFDGMEKLPACFEMFHLCKQLEKMENLEFLSVTNWASRLEKVGEELKDEIKGPAFHKMRPPKSLKHIELNTSRNVSPEVLNWLLLPREDYALDSLTITIRTLEELSHDLQGNMRYEESSKARRDLLETTRCCLGKLETLTVILTDERWHSETPAEVLDSLKYVFAPLYKLLPSCLNLSKFRLYVLSDSEHAKYTHPMFYIAASTLSDLAEKGALPQFIENIEMHFNHSISMEAHPVERLHQKWRRSHHHRYSQGSTRSLGDLNRRSRSTIICLDQHLTTIVDNLPYLRTFIISAPNSGYNTTRDIPLCQVPYLFGPLDYTSGIRLAEVMPGFGITDSIHLTRFIHSSQERLHRLPLFYLDAKLPMEFLTTCLERGIDLGLTLDQHLSYLAEIGSHH